jgi:hypothetical protein
MNLQTNCHNRFFMRLWIKEIEATRLMLECIPARVFCQCVTTVTCQNLINIFFGYIILHSFSNETSLFKTHKCSVLFMHMFLQCLWLEYLKNGPAFVICTYLTSEETWIINSQHARFCELTHSTPLTQLNILLIIRTRAVIITSVGSLQVFMCFRSWNSNVAAAGTLWCCGLWHHAAG